jgi:acyl-CoA thioesterase-2
VWIRPAGVIPPDPLLHAAVILFSTDNGHLYEVFRQHPDWAASRRLTATLDHTVWFHEPPRFDGWLLFASETSVAGGGRGLSSGRMFRPGGALAVTMAQESLVGERV